MFNVVIPMAGLGSRFMNVGYKTPKPFLPLNGIPMYRFVIDNIVPLKFREITNIHLIVRSEMVSLFTDDLSSIANLQIHTISELTEGAACTVLTVRNKINNDFPLIIANSDQYLEWDSENFFRCLIHPDWDGVISTFYQPNTSDIRWSYAAVNEDGQVTNVEEKKYISSLATTGVYGWSKGSDYVKYADKMIENNKRVNNEFYVCPVYNEAISDSSKIRVLNVYKMWGIGVPDDYEFFLKTFFKS
jgi:NDP-sugar pyrophosphorylase family protein